MSPNVSFGTQIWGKATYLDEHGNENLDIESPGASRYFIITAVITNENTDSFVRELVESVRKVYFQAGEMKSSGIGNNHERRKKVLDALMKTGIKYVALIVNKSEIIRTGGLQYKKSFRKFLPGFVYNRLYKTFSNLTVFNDKHGCEEFMDSVRDYVAARHQPTLFEDQVFEYADSKSSVLIQAADLLAGTWGKILDPDVPEEWRTALKISIAGNALMVDYWPPSAQSIFARSETKNYLNNIIRQNCHQLAQIYIENHHGASGLDQEEIAEREMRLAVLRFLLFQNEVMENDDFVYGKVIINHLVDIGYEEISLRKLANLVISPLRDSGVIISSGSRGYRIPTTVDDIIEFAKTTSEKVVPMIIRLGRARDQISMASDGQLDIVEESGNHIVNEFIRVQREPSTGG